MTSNTAALHPGSRWKIERSGDSLFGRDLLHLLPDAIPSIDWASVTFFEPTAVKERRIGTLLGSVTVSPGRTIVILLLDQKSAKQPGGYVAIKESGIRPVVYRGAIVEVAPICEGPYERLHEHAGQSGVFRDVPRSRLIDRSIANTGIGRVVDVAAVPNTEDGTILNQYMFLVQIAGEAPWMDENGERQFAASAKLAVCHGTELHEPKGAGLKRIRERTGEDPALEGGAFPQALGAKLDVGMVNEPLLNPAPAPKYDAEAAEAARPVFQATGLLKTVDHHSSPSEGAATATKKENGDLKPQTIPEAPLECSTPVRSEGPTPLQGNSSGGLQLPPGLRRNVTAPNTTSTTTPPSSSMTAQTANDALLPAPSLPKVPAPEVLVVEDDDSPPQRKVSSPSSAQQPPPPPQFQSRQTSAVATSQIEPPVAPPQKAPSASNGFPSGAAASSQPQRPQHSHFSRLPPMLRSDHDDSTHNGNDRLFRGMLANSFEKEYFRDPSYLFRSLTQPSKDPGPNSPYGSMMYKQTEVMDFE